MQFSFDDVQRFARWSGDHNPLHVDEAFARDTHFGQRIVHGVLTVLEALRRVAPQFDGKAVSALDMEFRSAVVVGGTYDTTIRRDADGSVLLSLEAQGQVALNVRAEVSTVQRSERDLSWVAAADRPVRQHPAQPTLEEFQRGIDILGSYPAMLDDAPPVAGVSPIQARVLALCSYVTGMELPGLRSLFTRIRVTFHDEAEPPVTELRYRARTVRFDRQFRLLDTELEVTASDGRPIATALLRSYVPFSPAASDIAQLAARLTPDAKGLAGKVALVVGGSRGLGADLAAVLALAGCRVCISARRDDASRRDAQAELPSGVAAIEFLQGDAGDVSWCQSAVETIRARHGRLDVLVLNACAPPPAIHLSAGSVAEYGTYIRDNLRLVESPLAAFAPALHDSGGAVVYISSSFVQEPPPGFGHYVAVKQAGEALVRTVGRESRIAGLIARPPVLQTRWNDTPAAVIGSIPADWAASHIVNALGATTPGRVASLVEFPAFDVFASPEPVSVAPADFGIRIAATFTTDALLPPLRFWNRELELNAAIDVAGYGQVLQSLLDPTSLLNAKGRGVNVVLLRVRDWLRELPEDQVEDIEFVRGHLESTAGDFERAIRSHCAQSSADTLLLLCPSQGVASSAESILIRQTEAALAGQLTAIPGLQVVKAAEHHADYAVKEDEIADPLRDDIAHIPYRDEYLCVLATLIARHLHRRISPLRKVIVVDCDNTLWRGVVGEVGPEGVEFDAGHHALHRTLARLAQSGLLVCLCSKNEEADVWRVFETRSELLLRRDQVVAAMVNWLPKSENIRTLAARLNLGLDSFVFIDDNPVECAEVRAGCPEVLTIEWPQDAAAAERLLRHTWEFDARETTKEDARRTELYREEFRRQELRAETLTFEDFISNLQLAVDFSPLTPEDRRRAAQLTLRTNQFNFTTIRREEADMQALVSGGRHEVRTVRVRDRFGDYGLVGLVIAERGGDVWTLDTFLLSCRVLGRGVEHRILSDLGSMAAAAGARAVKLRIESTKRNTPARAFLASAVPADLLRVDERGMECEIPSEMLATTRFEPATAGDAAPVTEGDPPAAAGAVDVERLRRRERQIVRTAGELATGALLRGVIEGRTTGSLASGSGQRSAGLAPRSAPREGEGFAIGGEIESVVYRAFSAALRMPIERVRTLDRLEALGCDSLRIVEITVALSDTYPWLPSTLLFEHRSVRDIVAEIATLAETGGSRAAAPVATPSHDRTAAGTAGQIAVVGMHVRCAGADSPRELWNLLSRGASAVRPVPVDREHFLHPLNDTRSHWAGLLDDVARFDVEVFGVSPREAEFMDPQLRVFLEVAWNALEDAGCVGQGHDPDTGVFAGVMYGDYGYRANQDTPGGANPYRCWEGFSLANRLSQLLGFGGPSMAVDTACSSSGTAIHLACAALRAGDCRVAVAGGVNLILDPDRFASLGRLGILSERGRCEPFGADADGTVIGEGAGVVVLRPLEDALRRGDRIYGVIKGTGISTGNGTVGFTAPNPQAQADAIRRSLRAAAIDPRTVTYVETHGTGTALGDPIEIRGLTLGYEAAELRDPALDVPARCRVGSIKGNIGHVEAGAGVLGLIKVLLQFEHGRLLPSITSPKPNPQIAFAQGRFDVQRELEPWDRLTATIDGKTVTVPRRAGLSSFGVGGANAHIVVEEAPAPSSPDSEIADRPCHLIAISARSEAALQRQIAGLTHHLRDTGDRDVSLPDLCFSVNTGRKHFEHRVALIARTPAALRDVLRSDAAASESRHAARGIAPASGGGPKIAFLFTGQGSQYAGMGRELYETQPVFRAALDRCAATFDRLLDRPLLQLLFAAEGSRDGELLNQTGYTQPALFAIEYALSELWKSWGIRPDVVMGHSVGEIAAMCVAGGVSLEDGLTLIAARGRLMQTLPAGGTMTSVMADEERVLAAIAGREEHVAIAAINAPGQIVISGVGAAVADIAARLDADGVKTKPLTVSHAFHSPLMKPMLAEYERVVRSIRFSTPTVPFVSCVDGGVSGRDVTQADYWLRNVIDPVRFAAGMKALEAAGVTAYLEVGPHPVLLGMGRQCVSDDASAAWLPSLRRDGDSWQTLLGSLARLYVLGAPVDWVAFDAPYQRKRTSAPAYDFNRRQYWLRSVPRIAVPPLDGVPVRATAAGPSPETSGRIAAPQTYELTWQRLTPNTPPPPVAGQWVLLADSAGLGDRWARLLTAAGAVVTTVRAGDAFRRDGDGYVIDPRSREDFDRVWQALELRPDDPPRIVDFWTLDIDGPADRPFDQVAAAVDNRLAAAAYLVQSLALKGVSKPSLWFVTSGAVNARTDADVVGRSALQSMVWGFGRTVALEQPELWGGLIDIGEESDIDAAVREVAGGGEDQVAFRKGVRLVARLRSKPGIKPGVISADGGNDRAPGLSSGGTYLITGGTGALGLHVAGWLVDRGARHIVLSSRRTNLDEDTLNRIRALEQRGAHVTAIAADVTRPDEVDMLLARIASSGAPLRGVVHAAGIDTPTPLKALTLPLIRPVVAPKVLGGLLLHERTRHLDLELFICFSSVASILGAQGRAHYAAANAFLDGLAAERRSEGLSALAVNWGPWKGGGMAQGPHLQQFERIGNYGLDPDAARGALDRALAAGADHAIVADIDWSTFGPIYQSRRPSALIADLASGSAPRTSGAANGHGSTWVEQLQSTAPEHRAATLEALVRAEVAETLGFDEAESVSVERGFYEIGMDSLTIADLVSRLNKRLAISCSALVFEHPDVRSLAGHLLQRLPLDDEAQSRGGSSSVPAQDGRQGVDSFAPTGWLHVLSQTTTDDRASRLTELIRAEVSRTLGFDRPDAVPIDQSFTNLGMDSLLSAELSGRLRSNLGISTTGLVFQYPSVEALRDYVLTNVLSTNGGHGAPASAAAGGDSASAITEGYSAASEREVFDFCARAWPRRSAELIPRRWRWMYVDSARRLGTEPLVWLHRDGGRIVGHMGSIPVRLKIGGDERLTGWLVDTMVLKSHRNRAVGSRLMVDAHADQPFSLSLGQTNEMRAILLRLGWKQVAPLQVAQRVLRPRNVLKGKLPGPAAWAAGIGLDGALALRDLIRERPRLQVRAVERFGEPHDRLWDRVAADLTCSVVRDASYLNWKYVCQPGQRFLRIELVAGGEVEAVAVWTLREPDEHYRYRRALLVDLVAPLGDAALLHDVLHAACNAAADAGADALTSMHIDRRVTAALRSCGFRLREPSRYLLVDPGDLDDAALDTLMSPDNWFITQGDSDIDRPW